MGDWIQHMRETAGKQYSPEFLQWIASLKMSKRAREACDVMLKHGAVTTDELTRRYGLKHPPRAIADLRDAGVLIKRENVRSGGKTIARYSLIDTISLDVESPRKPIPKSVKDKLIKDHGPQCAACRGRFRPTVLQVDHRIPFRVGGDPEEWSDDTVMLLCASDNRAKSWTCENCPNWETRDSGVCASCYWSHPDGAYEHIAGERQRRLVLTWQGESEIEKFLMSKDIAEGRNETMQEYVKRVLSSMMQG